MGSMTELMHASSPATPVPGHTPSFGAETTVATGYIAGLDGIRAICVSLVMVAHAGFGDVVPGGLGVTVFFFLSGFLITTLLMEEHARHGSISLKNFYARRMLRLSPELLLLIGFGLTVGLLFRSVSLVDVMSSLTYTSNYVILYQEHIGNAQARWPHLWSLAVEEHFYLTFPLLLAFVSGRIRTLAWLMAIVCVAAALWRVAIVSGGAPFGFSQTGEFAYTYIASDARADSIAYGCLTAALFRLFSGRNISTGAGIVMLALSAAMLLLSLLIRDPTFRETWRYSMQGAAVAIMFIGLFRSPSGTPIIRVLETPILRRMGILSYGAYLWHLEGISIYLQVMGINRDWASTIERLGIVLACFIFAMAAAQASLMITGPVRRLRNKFH